MQDVEHPNFMLFFLIFCPKQAEKNGIISPAFDGTLDASRISKMLQTYSFRLVITGCLSSTIPKES